MKIKRKNNILLLFKFALLYTEIATQFHVGEMTKKTNGKLYSNQLTIKGNQSKS